MFWFRLFSIACLAFILTCCSNNQKAFNAEDSYFDIKGFFDKEARRLESLEPPVRKLVRHNNNQETRFNKIDNWKAELQMFADSDINRPAWKNSYRVENKGEVTVYITTDNKLKTKRIEVISLNNKVKSIFILNKVENELYSTTEDLQYHVDSLYRIDKRQSTRLIGRDHFLIEGNF